MLGIVMVTVGYMDKKVKTAEKEKQIEYRFVPRTIYDEQIENINVVNTYSDMFADIDPIHS